jgi:hypothetical protein
VNIGTKNIYDKMLRYFAMGMIYDDVQEENFERTNLSILDFKLESIFNARKTMGRLNPSHIRPKSVQARLEIRRNFIWEISKDVNIPEDLPHFSEIKFIPVVKRMTRKDAMPCHIGSSARVELPSLQLVRSIRELGVNYRRYPSDEEKLLSELPKLEFDVRAKSIVEMESKVGVSFRVPSGRPPVIMLNNVRYMKPHSFSFVANLEPGILKPKPFVYKGVEVERFTLCFWGDYSLSRSNGYLLAFGYGLIENVMHAFYQKIKGNVSAVAIVRRGNEPMIFVQHMTNRVSVVIVPDLSAISISKYNPDANISLSGVTGDSNAIANYGNYLQTNSSNANRLLKSVFNFYRSDYPYYLMNYKKPFPMYLRNPTIIGGYNRYHLKGTRSICKLRLNFDEVQMSAEVDCSLETPSLIFAPVAESWADDVDGLFG